MNAAQALPYTTEALRRTVFEALGERAEDVGDQLIADIVELTQLGKPSLGCATTQQLVEELTARLSGDPQVWEYRTVGERHACTGCGASWTAPVDACPVCS